jgi:glyoxylase-like metal-dependent hydrolase (beta-lactamase superfamily II)
MAPMSVRVHHLGCGRLHPEPGRFVFERGGHRHLVCHCLLVEIGDALVLVDTGFGRADLADPRRRLGRMFLSTVRPELDERGTAIAQLERRGLDPRAVRHIVVTHLDLDHIGGLSDFPEATVHVMRTEHEQAHARSGFHDRQRYRPVQWSHGVRWQLHDVAGDTWNGFRAVRALPGLPPEILLVPMVGHSAGHAAVAVQGADGWLLHCGDAYFHRGELDPRAPECPPGLRFFQWLVAHDRRARLHNRERLRELARAGDGVRLFCAHDPHELRTLQSPVELAGDA